MPTARNRRMIELAHVGRNYTRADGQRVNAVDDVSLIVPEGEFVCLIGPSGCGKSTLLQMVAGLDTPSSGAVVVDGKEIAGPGRERGMVFQRDSVFPWLRVVDNVEYGLKCRGVAPVRAARSRATICAGVGLSHVEQAWPRELSGGMLKRVAIVGPSLRMAEKCCSWTSRLARLTMSPVTNSRTSCSISGKSPAESFQPCCS